MTTPIASYTVTALSSSSPVNVPAQSFNITETGDIIFLAPNGQTVAAFAKGQWEQVVPGAST